MHDPMTLAWEVRGPWLRRNSITGLASPIPEPHVSGREEIEKMQRKHVKAAAVYQCPGCGACGKIDPHNYVAVVQHADDCPRMDEYEEQR